jgi:succinate dehydrogenase / fumarate reductase cytochrome b subunit
MLVGRKTDGKLVQRPLSPHLQVYRPQITTVTSILHRVTGIAISIGTLLLVWWLVAAASGVGAFDTVQGFVGSPLGLLLLFGWTAALFYHFFAGIRHLGWDAGFGFDKATYHSTGYAVFIATAVATVLVWAIGLAMWA